MKVQKTLIAAFAALICSASAEFGICPPNPAGVGNFQPSKYQGSWYEIYRDKELWYEGPNTQCVVATYKYKPDQWFY